MRLPVSTCLMLRSRVAGFVLVFSLLTGYAAAQRGALVRPANIAQLTELSANIIRGSIVSARVEPHPQFSHLTTVVVTIRVEETLKGSAGGQFTFRQFIWDLRDKYDAAGYRKGDNILLLLGPVSQYGLSSPAGMEQGRFRISRDAKGNWMAANGLGNIGLFRGVAAQASLAGAKFSAATAATIAHPQPGPVSLSQLEEIIRQFSGAADRNRKKSGSPK